MKKRILSMALVLCMVLTLLPVSALAADPVPVTELWVGTTQVVQSGGTVTGDTSGEGWSFDSATATLTLNGANITTTAHDGISGDYSDFYYGIYCYGDLNIIVTGDSTIDARAAADRSCGIYVRGNLSVSGSAELTTKGNWRGLCVNENLSLSGAVTLSAIAESTSLETIDGVYVVNSITVSDTANLIGIAKGGQFRTNGIYCMRGNITVDSGATLTGRLDDGGTQYNSDINAGVCAGYTTYYGGQVLVEGTLVARAGSATENGNVAGLSLVNVEMIISGNGSVSAESGDLGGTSSTSYGVSARGTSSVQVNAGGFRASGGTCAVNPSSTNITINGTPVYYEVSANRDGSGAIVITDTETWNSTYNGNFGAYKYINATTLYEVYVNGTQVTRVNRHDVLGDGTVSYLPAAEGSPARLTLSGASLTTLQLDGDTEFALTGTNAIGTVTNAGAVTVSGGGGLTLTGGLDCGSESLTVASGAALTVQGTVTAGTVVNGGTLVNEGTLLLPEATTVGQIQAMNLTGDGIVKAGSRVYLGGILYADGGDASPGGIDLSTLPAEGTYYRAGSGYALFTPATADPAANAKLELHGAIISTTSATAISLPSDAQVDIVVAGDSSITAGGSGNVIYTNGQALSVTGSGDLTLAGNYYGISVNGTGAVSINIDGDLTFDTVYQPISTSVDITVSAKSITSNSGYYFNSGGGSVSLTATDGDIVFDETGKTNKSYKISADQNITLNAPNGKIDITHGGSSYALTSSSGTVNVTALNDVIINAASGGGISTSSGGVSVTSQSGNIQMNCGDHYECVTAYITGDAITLSAAEDITLNGSVAYTNAIAASSRAVNITAGGTLSSTSAYGFQVGALTIQANEVSIEGTTQDGIQAGSVSITNTDGTSNCESVSVTATSNVTSRAAIYSFNDVTVKADDLLLLGRGGAKAIIASGTVTIGDAGLIVGPIGVSDTSGIDSRIICAANGGKLGYSGLNLETPPGEATYYEADSGYFIFAPAEGTAPASLAMHQADYQAEVCLPNSPIALILNGANEVFVISAKDNVTISGSGSLDAYRIANEDESAALTISSGAVLNTLYQTKNAQDVYTNTIFGRYTSNDQYGVSIHNSSLLKLTTGAVLTLEGDGYLYFEQDSSLANMVIGANASIVNNTFIMLPQGTTSAQIAALPLSGTGVVRVATAYNMVGRATSWDTYTKGGVALKEITGGLDLSIGDHSGATIDSDGYTYSNNTLTLGNAYITGGLTLPTDAPVTINSDSSAVISGLIRGDGHAPLRLTFTGTAPLSINGGINSGMNGDTVTVRSGAQVTLNGSISIGASGTDGTLTVTGAGTVLALTSGSAYGAICDTVTVQNGAALTVHTQGAGTMGIEALSGGVSVTGGSTLTAGCDYGVYIIGGKLTVDSTSKLITNGAVAPFCIVGAANSTQGDVLSLGGDLPGGTEIAWRQATNGSGTTHTYWSLVPTNGTLSVSNVDSTPVTLTGAATGSLTFATAASTPTGGDSGSSGSSFYTLTFAANGGSSIASLSKTSGTVIDLSGYKPTREGYDFDGWYSDHALTAQITSVTLTKNTTVYAKWTEQITNPFADVSDSAYYHDAVLWAVEKNVTSGTSSTTFSPDMICTRAQLVTFLWRAMGSPEPTSANCPFTDVSADAYYYKAVLWAVETGITAGTSATTFGPDDTVTRGQAVTFLWRAAGKPETTSANPFTDVTEDAYYYDAVLWAREKGVTQGTSSMTFSPNALCTRAQIVTFLYRYAAE
ncbi:hypothetical protein SDC9_57762 [bioreactor metagenome]|uniref:SLH domain-containing protein n=1 Tax=bioreactor metagenome TaxID=1076179 RepID=A0A644X6H4_9ZZZZ